MSQQTEMASWGRLERVNCAAARQQVDDPFFTKTKTASAIVMLQCQRHIDIDSNLHSVIKARFWWG